MVTIKDIARLTGTSATAVSFVLNNKDRKRVHPDKRKAILEAAEKHGYRRNLAARGLALKRTFRIATCLHGFFEQSPVLGHFGQYETVSLVARKLYSVGYGMDLLQIDKRAALSEVSRTLAQEKVDGVLFAYWDPQLLKQVVAALKEEGIATAAIESSFVKECYSAVIDRENGFRSATRYLLDCGLKKVVLLDCRMGMYGEPKRAGYEEAMREAGHSPYPIFSAEFPKIRPVAEATARILGAVPDIEGVLISENIFAPTVMHVLGDPRLRLIGCGDACFADICHPKLSYLRLPHEKLVEASIGNLVSQIESPEASRTLRTVVDCELVIQET